MRFSADNIPDIAVRASCERTLAYAHLWLGQGLEAKSDAKGACDHYTKFLEQADQNNPDRRDAIHKCAAVCGHSCVGP